MKRLLLGIMFLGILASPLKADASSPNFAFHIGGEEWVHESVAPMELMEDTVEVTNETESPLQFRLVDTENLNGSSLYDVMMYSYNNSDFVKLNELSSEWVQVESGETVELPLQGYMPAEVNNDFQSMEMQARFNFEGRLLETDSEDVDIIQKGDKVIAKTGDNTHVGLLSITMLVSLAVLIVLIVRRWYIEKRQ